MEWELPTNCGFFLIIDPCLMIIMYDCMFIVAHLKRTRESLVETLCIRNKEFMPEIDEFFIIFFCILIAGKERYFYNNKKITYPNLWFSINQYSKSNSYCMLRGDTKIIEIHNIIKTKKGDIFIIGKHFIEYLPLYLYPCHSSLLDIHVVKGLSDLKAWSINFISSKCIVLPNIDDNNSFISMPIIHNFNWYIK